MLTLLGQLSQDLVEARDKLLQRLPRLLLELLLVQRFHLERQVAASLQVQRDLALAVEVVAVVATVEVLFARTNFTQALHLLDAVFLYDGLRARVQVTQVKEHFAGDRHKLNQIIPAATLLRSLLLAVARCEVVSESGIVEHPRFFPVFISDAERGSAESHEAQIEKFIHEDLVEIKDCAGSVYDYWFPVARRFARSDAPRPHEVDLLAVGVSRLYQLIVLK